MMRSNKRAPRRTAEKDIEEFIPAAESDEATRKPADQSHKTEGESIRCATPPR